MTALSSNNNNNISLFSLLLLFLLLIKVESQNTWFSYNFFTTHSITLTYESSAVVPPDEPYVRLTPTANTAGRVLYRTPMIMWQNLTQSSFETTITFQITPFLHVTSGEGLTFFIIPVNSTSSLPGLGAGGNLGIYDVVFPERSPVFAVEFDVASTQGPLDPPYPHIGINMNSQRSQNATRFENAVGPLVTARITYHAPTRRINVFATAGATTATVSFVLNLAAFLPQRVQLGLSASASRSINAALFDVHSWHFNSSMVPDFNTGTRMKNSETYIKKYVM